MIPLCILLMMALRASLPLAVFCSSLQYNTDLDGLSENERREFLEDSQDSSSALRIKTGVSSTKAAIGKLLSPGFGAKNNPSLEDVASIEEEVRGNPLCFEDGAFNYDDCCIGEGDDGLAGNAQCWDEIYSFEQCCLPQRGRGNETAMARARKEFFGCGNTFFQNVRKDAWIFFKFGEMHPRMFQSHARSIVNWVQL